MLFDIEPMPDPREDLSCPECGKMLVPAVGYSTCPDWCGGLHPGLTSNELLLIQMQIDIDKSRGITCG